MANKELEKVKGFIEDEANKVEAVVHPTIVIIEAWWSKHFHNSKVSGDTELYNQLHAAKEELKTALTKPQL